MYPACANLIHLQKQRSPIRLKSILKIDLPTSNTASNGSFSNLITQTSANANTIVQAPLMFVRGGFINPNNSLRSAGFLGFYWSSVGLDNSYAYYLDVYPGGIRPSNNYYRYFGSPLRCVALGG